MKRKNQLGFYYLGVPSAASRHGITMWCRLAASGLMLQTAFNNPLAGPSILGINSGASLGVALVMLAVEEALLQEYLPYPVSFP